MAARVLVNYDIPLNEADIKELYTIVATHVISSYARDDFSKVKAAEIDTVVRTMMSGILRGHISIPTPAISGVIECDSNINSIPNFSSSKNETN